jgi:hypothetical protein
MELDFIDRSLRTSGIVLLVFLPFGVYYLGVFPTLAVFSGGVWGILNLIFISALVRATLRPQGADRRKAYGIALFKFPLLYAAGFFLLKVHGFEPLFLLIGFSSLFVVIVLKAVGRMVAHVDDSSSTDQAHQSQSVQGVS